VKFYHRITSVFPDYPASFWDDEALHFPKVPVIGFAYSHRLKVSAWTSCAALEQEVDDHLIVHLYRWVLSSTWKFRLMFFNVCSRRWTLSVLFLPVIGHKTMVPETNNLSWPSYAINPALRDITRNSQTETSVALRNSSPVRRWHSMVIYWLIGNSFSLLRYKLPIALTEMFNWPPQAQHHAVESPS